MRGARLISQSGQIRKVLVVEDPRPSGEVATRIGEVIPHGMVLRRGHEEVDHSASGRERMVAALI